MKLFKSLFLGSVAGLAAVAGAQAADLPMAEPVEYVKVCDTYGAGFFYIPGGETCLKISGMVRADALVMEQLDKKKGGNKDNLLAFRARGQVNFDARTATEYGLLRSFIRLQADRRSGPQATGAGIIDKAYIQFAGLTAGYLDSMFDFKPYPSYSGQYVSDISTLVFAYTAQFGNGFSATIAAEDRTYRDASRNLNGISQVPGGTLNHAPERFSTNAGQHAPDIVGNLRVEQGWGEAKLSGAGHQIRTGDREDWGFAVQGGVLVNLPMLGEDDFVYASGAYTDGALSYAISGQDTGIGGVFNPQSGVPQADFIRKSGSDNIKTTQAWNVNGGFVHHFNPNWRVGFAGSYVDVDYDGKLLGKLGHNNFKKFNPDWTAGQFSGQLVWTPVKNLDIGAEVDYTNFFDAPQGFRNGGGYTGKNGRENTLAGRFRVQRNF